MKNKDNESLKDILVRTGRKMTEEETEKYYAAILKMAKKNPPSFFSVPLNEHISKESTVLEYTGFDLKVQRYIRMGPATIFAKAMLNANILGTVNKFILPTGESMYNLEPGAYKVEFVGALPFKWQEPVYHYLQQDRLFNAGMHLTLNFNPFCGILNVEYKTVIEEGTTLATLMWGTIPNEYNSLLERARDVQ
jgi:hypothetical protein